MAIVNGPLFSLDASGALGQALVFTKWKGRNVVREYVKPANPKSIAQRGRRTWVSLLNAIWQGMSPTDKDSWADLAASGNYSTFNGFTSYNLDEQTVGNPPTKNRSDTPTAVTASIMDASETPGTNRIDLQIEMNATQAGTYGIVALAEGGTAPGVDELAAVARYDSTTTDVQEVAITDLPAGTYSVSYFAVSEDGAISTQLDSASSIVVTGTF